MVQNLIRENFDKCNKWLAIHHNFLDLSFFSVYLFLTYVKSLQPNCSSFTHQKSMIDPNFFLSKFCVIRILQIRMCMHVCTLCYSYGTAEWLRTNTDGSDRQAFQGCRAIIREVQLSNSISSSVHAGMYVRTYVYTCVLYMFIRAYMLYMHMHSHLCLVGLCVHTYLYYCMYIFINYWLCIHYVYLLHTYVGMYSKSLKAVCPSVFSKF